MSEIVMRVENLGKQYRIRRHETYRDLRETVAHLCAAPFRRLRSATPAQRPPRHPDTIWALRDLSFDVLRGEVLGIVGSNGAGKTTLFKILARITDPTTGDVEYRGQVGSLLEVGTGFHPELTGRENIYLNGAILGMSRTDIRRRFDEIVAFSGVEEFIDAPIKRYSSGMQMRLAFAVAAHLESDILLIDEVLAVGDLAFQERCLGKMQDVARDGRTVLFISHSMHSVALLCTRGLVLRDGRLAYWGDTRTAVTNYVASCHEDLKNRECTRRLGTGEYRFTYVRPVKPIFDAHENKRFQFRIERQTTHAPPAFLSADIVNSLGMIVAQCDSRLVGHGIEDCALTEGEFSFRTPWLKSGRYHLDVYIFTREVIDQYQHACSFDITPIMPYPHGATSDATADGLVLARFGWSSAPVLHAEHRPDSALPTGRPGEGS